MVLFYLGQVPAQWFTEAGDAALAGGVLRFYAVGTSTPKAVFSDYQGVTAAGTAVTLNASGRANVFLDGLYSVTLEDSEGVQIGAKVDGIGNAAMTGDGSTLVIETYDDLRQFDGTDFRACVVQGRTANGDGGSGLFVWDALETTADDGGAILAPLTLPLSGRWVRVRGDTLDPRWYGCRIDGTTADDTQLALALAASVTLKARLHFEGGYSRVTSNTAIPTGARVSCGEAAGLTATSSAVTLTVPAGAIFTGSAACFGGMLQPLFSGIDTPLIPLSWMGGASVDSMLDKWAAASGIAGQTYLLDKSVAGIIPAFLAGRHLDVVPGCVHTVNATAQSLDVDVIVPSATHWMSWGAIANIGSVNVGNRPCPVEWFGAFGNGTTNDHVPIAAACASSWVEIGIGKYLCNGDISMDGLRISGKLVSATGADVISDTASMPASSIIMYDDKSFASTSGDIALDSVGFYANKSAGTGIGLQVGGSIIAKNCVIGLFGGAEAKASYIDTQDCYANDPSVFVTTLDTAKFHTNLRTTTYYDRRIFRPGSSFETIYHRKEIGTSADYDIVLTARNTDGLEDGKTHLSLDHIEANSVSFNSITAGAQKSVDLTATGATYTVQASDPSVIVFSPGAENKTVILPAAAGATCKIRYFVCNFKQADNAWIWFSGDIIYGVSAPGGRFDAFVRTAIFIDALGKWAL